MKLPPARIWFEASYKLYDFFNNTPADGSKVGSLGSITIFVWL